MKKFEARLTMPILMMNGGDDFLSPLKQTQIPMFRLLGTPAKNKRRAVFESGHSLPLLDVIEEVLPWLDRYLGPITPKRP